MITPSFITSLNDNEVFVFGSNLAGAHGGGAARIAYEKFGAEWGVGVGPTGKCYAIPTMQGGVETIAPYVDDFIEYAELHSEQMFLVTRIGCGIAGFHDSEIAPLFTAAADMPNVALPRGWREMIEADKARRLARADGKDTFLQRRGLLVRRWVSILWRLLGL